MSVDILMIGPMLRSTMDALDIAYEVHRYWLADEKQALLAEVGHCIKAIATDGHRGAPPHVVEQLPNLEMIGCFGVGYDGIDIPFVTGRGIKVSNTPNVLNDAVAELTLAMMLGLCRRIPQSDRYVRGGKWLTKGFGLTNELTGATVGILGLGRIGKEIARRCEVFKMSIAYHGRREQLDQPYRYYSDLAEMARDVDYLVVIAPGSPETRGIVSREVLEALGPDGALVNVARGSLVDEEALVELLASGKLGGAALDVFADEPRVPHALVEMDNVVLSPHQGSATHKTRKAMGDLVVDNIAAHFAGKPLLTPVN